MHIFLLHCIGILFELDLVLHCFPRLFLLPSFLQLIVDLFGIEDEQDTLEQFLAYFIRGSFGGVLTIKISTIGISSIQFGSCSAELVVSRLDFYEDLLTVLVDPIIVICFHLTLKGFFYGNRIFLELGQIDLDLTDGHFRDELVHVHFLLTENGIGEFLPDLLYHIQTSIHLTVLRFHLLKPLQRVQLEPPRSTLHSSPIQVIPHCQRNLKDIVESVINPK